MRSVMVTAVLALMAGAGLGVVTFGCGEPAAMAPRAEETRSLHVEGAQVKAQAQGQGQGQAPVRVEEATRATRLAVRRLVIARGVRDREPLDAITDLTLGEAARVYAFVEIDNPERAPGSVVVTFEAPSGKTERGDVTLGVGAEKRWRTWAFTRGVREPGTWTAIVRDERGRELARAPFEVTAEATL